jgi:hypothetical protein
MIPCFNMTHFVAVNKLTLRSLLVSSGMKKRHTAIYLTCNPRTRKMMDAVFRRAPAALGLPDVLTH